MREINRFSSIVEEGAAVALVEAPEPIRSKIVVVGGGQAGLAVGYHLKKLGVDDFVILDGAARVGDAWRKRWDSMKLFTPASVAFFLLGLGNYVYTFFMAHRLTNMSVLLFSASVIVFLIGLISEQITALMYKADR